MNKKKLIIVGDGETAQIAYEYFTYDSDYDVEAFSVEKQYLDKKELFGLPVVPFDNVEEFYTPDHYDAFVAVSYIQLNRVRERLFRMAKEKGYSLPSYVSSRAFVWRNVTIGENCMVFENNVLQHNVIVGNNVILWSGNHIGHQSRIKDNVYIASHVVISGFCEIGEYSFLGVNSALNDNVRIANDCIIGSGAVVTKNTEPGKIYVGNPAKVLPKRSSFAAFGVKEDSI